MPTSSDLVRSSSSIFEYSIWAMAKGSLPSISGVFARAGCGRLGLLRRLGAEVGAGGRRHALDLGGAAGRAFEETCASSAWRSRRPSRTSPRSGARSRKADRKQSFAHSTMRGCFPLVFLHGLGGGNAVWDARSEHFRALGYRCTAWDQPGYGETPAGRALRPRDSWPRRSTGRSATRGGPRRPQHGRAGRAGVLRALSRRRSPPSPSASPAPRSRPAPTFAQHFVEARIGPLDAGKTMAEIASEVMPTQRGRSHGPGGPGSSRSGSWPAVPPETYRKAVQLITTFDRRADLPKIAVPTLLVAGSDDVTAPAPLMGGMAQKIPGAEFVVLRGCGHLGPMDQPERVQHGARRVPAPAQAIVPDAWANTATTRAPWPRLVEPDRVHRDVYADPEVFQLEMERLWSRTWIYVGHASQVPQPGDFFTADIAAQAGDHGAPHRRQRARADEPLRAQGHEGGLRPCRQHRQDLPLSVPRVDLPYGRYPPPHSAEGGLCRHRDAAVGPGPGDAARPIAASSSPASATDGIGFRGVLRRLALLHRQPRRPLARGRAGDRRRLPALPAQLQLEDVRREPERHDASDDRARLLGRHGEEAVGRQAGGHAQADVDRAVSRPSPTTTSSSTTWACASTPHGHGFSGVNFSIHSSYSRIAGLRGRDAARLRRGAREADPRHRAPQHRLLPEPHHQGRDPVDPRRAAARRRQDA